MLTVSISSPAGWRETTGLPGNRRELLVRSEVSPDKDCVFVFLCICIFVYLCICVYLYLLFISEESLVRLICIFVYFLLLSKRCHDQHLFICIFWSWLYSQIQKYKATRQIRGVPWSSLRVVFILFHGSLQNKKEIIKIIIVNNDQELPCAKKGSLYSYPII